MMKAALLLILTFCPSPFYFRPRPLWRFGVRGHKRHSVALGGRAKESEKMRGVVRAGWHVRCDVWRARDERDAALQTEGVAAKKKPKNTKFL